LALQCVLLVLLVDLKSNEYLAARRQRVNGITIRRSFRGALLGPGRQIDVGHVGTLLRSIGWYASLLSGDWWRIPCICCQGFWS